RPERVPSDAEILEREEARRAVVASVLALDEPYRTVLLLRYFEDSPPREIARRVGVPFETVRTRLKRALDLVRADLDRRRGDRRAWCLALLPFSRLAPRAGPFASLRLEITQMSMPLQFSIGTLVLGSLVAGVAGWLSRGDAPPVAAPARPAVAARPAAPPVVFVRGGIEVQPADGLNFGTVPKGTRAAKEIAVRNGNPKAAMKIAAARLVDPKSVRSGEPGEPAANADHFRVQVIEDEPGKAARIVVIVKGTMPAGEFSATLSLETGVPDGPARLLIPIQGSVK
ncbi:MAG TPA: sigma-70 family RNA polymerase sigma factor, partial [Planctomycetota bacterium]|nr:sigma-70 family RNA polymerase sigma factor [Planctomycetota bacterium]